MHWFQYIKETDHRNRSLMYFRILTYRNTEMWINVFTNDPVYLGSGAFCLGYLEVGHKLHSWKEGEFHTFRLSILESISIKACTFVWQKYNYNLTLHTFTLRGKISWALLGENNLCSSVHQSFFQYTAVADYTLDLQRCSNIDFSIQTDLPGRL